MGFIMSVEKRFNVKERYLSDRFINPVTMEATVIECANKDIIFLCQTSFGTMGSVAREFTLRVKGKTVEHNKSEVDRYVEELIELKDILEGMINKFRHSSTNFNVVEVLCGDTPLMFQAILNDKEARINIYGHGLYDMTIHHNRKTYSSLAQFIMRLEEMLNPIKSHLMQIQSIPFSKLHGVEV
jgi:hypothetical protein